MWHSILCVSRSISYVCLSFKQVLTQMVLQLYLLEGSEAVVVKLVVNWLNKEIVALYIYIYIYTWGSISFCVDICTFVMII